MKRLLKFKSMLVEHLISLIHNSCKGGEVKMKKPTIKKVVNVVKTSRKSACTCCGGGGD